MPNAGTRSRRAPAIVWELGVAALVGLAVGAAIWVFKRMIEAAEWLAYGWYAEAWAEVGFPWIVVVPIVGGLVVGIILHLSRQPEELGHGVQEVIEAVVLDVNEFPERGTAVKASVAALSLGAGASLGPEDPAVEIGGSVGHFAGRAAAFDHPRVQTMVAAGAAGGLSAAFHAPLAAIVFAAEIFGLRLASRAIAIVAVAAALAYLVMRALTPEVQPSVPAHGLAGLLQTGLAVGLGVLAGSIAAVQIRLMYSLEHSFIRWRRPPRWLKPAMGGAMLGVAGIAFPELLGIGYGTLESMLAGQVPLPALLLALMVGKMVLMAVSFGSGFLGGFFAPSFFIGAALGSLYGLAAATLLPGQPLRPEVFAAVGMAAVLAGSVRAPFTAVLLVAALSGSYALTPILLAACLPAHWVSRSLEADSLYTYGIEHPALGRTHRAQR